MYSFSCLLWPLISQWAFLHLKIFVFQPQSPQAALEPISIYLSSNEKWRIQIAILFLSRSQIVAMQNNRIHLILFDDDRSPAYPIDWIFEWRQWAWKVVAQWSTKAQS